MAQKKFNVDDELLLAFLKQMRKRGFYGTAEIKYFDGDIKQINVVESLNLEQFERDTIVE